MVAFLATLLGHAQRGGGGMATVPYHEVEENDGLQNGSSGLDDDGEVEAAKCWYNMKNVDIKYLPEAGVVEHWRPEQTTHHADPRFETRNTLSDWQHVPIVSLALLLPYI